MRRSKKGFTLIELLVVIAIIAILAAILFPVFAQAKEAAKRTTCLSNQHQVGTATNMYMDTYDDRVPLQNYIVCTAANCWGGAQPNQSNWVLDVAPFVNNLRFFRCPSDPNANDQGLSLDPRTDQPLPANAPQRDRDFAWATRSNYGINGQYITNFAVVGGQPVVYAVSGSQIAATAQTVLAVESIWNRTASGQPAGGGNWAVDPPCVFDINGQITTPLPSGATGYYWFGGWAPTTPLVWNVFGGAWPWHLGKNRGADTWKRRNEGTLSTVFMDSHSKAMKVDSLGAGCDVRTGFAGRIFDKTAYLWDLDN